MLLFPTRPSPCRALRDARVRVLIDRHFDFVWRSLRRLGVRESDVDDAAQDVFVVAVRRLDDILEERERAFLFGAAVRVCSTRRRFARRHPEDACGSSDDHVLTLPDPEKLVQLRQARQLVDDVLGSLSEELRSVFVLAELEELSVREIAEREGLPEGTVSSRLRAARAKFSAAVERRHACDRFARRAQPGARGAGAPFHARFYEA